MDRNMVRAVVEKHNATSEEMANKLKAGSPSKVGSPPALTPPGTVMAEANATVAMSAATTEHDSDVWVSHSPPALINSVCWTVKTSFGVLPSLLRRVKKCRGIDSLMNCSNQIHLTVYQSYTDMLKFRGVHGSPGKC